MKDKSYPLQTDKRIDPSNKKLRSFQICSKSKYMKKKNIKVDVKKKNLV